MSTEPATDWSQGENIPAPKPHALALFPVNDTERAERFVKLFAAELRYVHAWKRWLLWDGNRWTSDADGAVFRKAQELSPILLREALEIEDADKRKKAVGEAIKAGDKAKIEALVTLAQNHLGASPTLFDADPLLLGVLNGVVDLRTGECRPARREDFMIKCINADYDCSATCNTWEQFLHRVFDGDTELISFVQRAIGYSLTGLTSEQCLFFLFGTGQNGKSTFTKLLEALLGTYALKSVSSLYTLAANGRQPLDEIARLVGKRFVTGSETEEGDDLAESRVKDITGGDTQTGRELYCQAFNFEASHKLWIYGNHPPNVRGNDHGIWRRIKLIPFRVQIPDAEKDPDLPNKLWAERSGILNWAIKGCLEWREHGLGEARVVMRPPQIIAKMRTNLVSSLTKCVGNRARSTEVPYIRRTRFGRKTEATVIFRSRQRSRKELASALASKGAKAERNVIGPAFRCGYLKSAKAAVTFA
ncbi:MAG TPA: phage/plasmid primase, P4 family [Candidatus Udaeobacter sp.]|nr:phage/plasmid primase, P4 family [Candidatus Udaeobacter sp.]